MLPPITGFDGDEHKAFSLQGGNAAALLIHGFPGTPNEMRPLAETLHSAGWTVYTPLLPGFGSEINTLANRHYGEWLTTVETALHELKPKHSPILLLGHSMGGALAIAASAHQIVDGLITLAPFYKIPHLLWMFLPVIKHILPQFKPFYLYRPDFTDPKVREGVTRLMPGMNIDDPAIRSAIRDFAIPVNLIDQVRIAGENAYQHAPKVTCPTLIIQGSRDELVRPAITRQLVARLGGKTQYIEVSAEHELELDNHPAWEKVKQLVLKFAGEVVA